ncbi:MAG: phytanoyl-CoA dioxygenase family protein [bacterium]|nr:phytanoyl-CoA dioxygenase family protein [bacterium]
MFEPEMKRFYDTQGYLVAKSVFQLSEMAGIQKRVEEIIADPCQAPRGVSVSREGDTIKDKSSAEAQNMSVRAMAFLVRFDPLFAAFAVHPGLLELVRGLIGPKIMIFRDQMLLKPPGGQAKPLHQDQSYFQVQPENDLVTAWIAMDDATKDNGCMAYVPTSHKYGIFDIEQDPDRPVHHVPKTGNLNLPAAVACPVSAGSVIFHHGLTLHHSADNRTESWRKALILHFATTQARSRRQQLNEEISLVID